MQILTKETKKENMDLNTTNEYKFPYLGMNDFDSSIVKPGWTKTKKFNITNTGTSTITYSVYWEDVLNDYHYDVRPNYTLYKNDTVIVNGKANYPFNSGDVFLDNIELRPNQTDKYELVFTYAPNVDQKLIDNNVNRLYYSALKVVKK